MNGKPESSESFSKVKIFKPKPVRLCPPRRKKINQTIKRTKTGTINYPISKKQFVNLDDISIEEIDKDFKIYKENKEEEYCHNELLNIINNSNVNKKGEKKQKIKRCKGPDKINSEFMKDSYFSAIINEINSLFVSQPENNK